MSKRSEALAAIRAAAAIGDTKTALRVYVESRVSAAAYRQAWAEGERFAAWDKAGRP